MEWMEMKVRGRERCPVAAEWETAQTLGGRELGDPASGGQKCKDASRVHCVLWSFATRGPENQCSQGTSLLARGDGWRS